MSTEALGIIELVEVCSRIEHRSTALFVVLGSWVADEADPATQRLWAEACQRHAWHAELWQARTPKIPVADATSETVDGSFAGAADDRTGSYLAELAALRAELALLETRLDRDLDPSTIRTISLVDADLAELEQRFLEI